MNEENSSTQSRRAFLKNSAIVAGVTVAPGVLLYSVSQAKPSGDAVSSKVRWGMLIDTTKCTEDCNECVTACTNEHGLTEDVPANVKPQWIRKI